MHTARTHTSIMHNKFIVVGKKNGNELAPPSKLTMGSANYTTEGLTEQANLIHVIESPQLSQFYLNRGNLLLGDPSEAETKQSDNGWSEPIAVGNATVRVNFSPEPGKQKTQIDAIVQAIKNATNSVLFCLFSPTDSGLRNACFGAGDRGLMMFGLVNHIVKPKPGQEDGDPNLLHADQLAAIELFHRSRDKRDVIDASFFDHNHTPVGFETEFNLYPGSKPPPYPPVIIHHKFVLIDAETDHPVIYTGSANMSENSEHHNDENLLEISGDTALSSVYMAEFMRLYEHYRARAIAIAIQLGDRPPEALMLQPEFARWGRKYFKEGTLEYKARLAII
ncbi:MAG: phospholipase D-like domain-containing protein, partial [Burkholderiaceae bacterium]